MKPLRRDVLFTLALKLCLLFFLWFFCFKQAERSTLSIHDWLLGSDTAISSHSSK